MSTIAKKVPKLPLIRIIVSALGFAVVIAFLVTRYFPDFYADYMQAAPGFSLIALLIVSTLIQLGIWRAWRAYKYKV